MSELAIVTDPIEEAIFLAHHPSAIAQYMGQPIRSCASCRSAAEAVRSAINKCGTPVVHRDSGGRVIVALRKLRVRLLILALRRLNVPCGAFGGVGHPKGEHDEQHRWCMKRFGHEDSHAYDFVPVQRQPLWRERAIAQGYDHTEWWDAS